MKPFVCFVAALLISPFLFAQSSPSPTWKIKKFGISMGEDMDMLRNMDQAYFLDMVAGEGIPSYSGYTASYQDVYSSICENPHLRAELVLEPARWKNTEVKIGILGVFDRIDAMSFQKTSEEGTSTDYVNFSAVGHEVGLELSLQKYVQFLNAFRLYGGAGSHIAYSFGNTLSISQSSYQTVEDLSFWESEFDPEVGYEDSYEYYDLKNGIHQRLFLQGGASVTIFKRVEWGLVYRMGFGYRQPLGSSMQFTKLQSASMMLNYVLK